MHKALEAELSSGAIHSLPSLKVWTSAQLESATQSTKDGSPRVMRLLEDIQEQRWARLLAEADAARSEKVEKDLDAQLRQTEQETTALTHVPAVQPFYSPQPQLEHQDLEAQAARDTLALSVIVRANNGQLRYDVKVVPALTKLTLASLTGGSVSHTGSFARLKGRRGRFVLQTV